MPPPAVPQPLGFSRRPAAWQTHRSCWCLSEQTTARKTHSGALCEPPSRPASPQGLAPCRRRCERTALQAHSLARALSGSMSRALNTTRGQASSQHRGSGGGAPPLPSTCCTCAGPDILAPDRGLCWGMGSGLCSAGGTLAARDSCGLGWRLQEWMCSDIQAQRKCFVQRELATRRRAWSRQMPCFHARRVAQTQLPLTPQPS